MLALQHVPASVTGADEEEEEALSLKLISGCSFNPGSPKRCQILFSL